MITRRGRFSVLAALGLGGVLLLWVQRCTHSADGPAAASPAPTHGGERPPAATAPAASAGRADAGARPAAGSAQSPATSARVLQSTEDRDRELLADIERRTKGSPPAAVHELIALRRGGAGRTELARFIDERLSDRLLIRVAAQRWLRAVAPMPGMAAETPQPPSDSKLGSGGGPIRIAPMPPRR